LPQGNGFSFAIYDVKCLKSIIEVSYRLYLFSLKLKIGTDHATDFTKTPDK